MTTQKSDSFVTMNLDLNEKGTFEICDGSGIMCVANQEIKYVEKNCGSCKICTNCYRLPFILKETEIVDLDAPEKLYRVYFNINKYNFQVEPVSDTFSA